MAAKAEPIKVGTRVGRWVTQSSPVSKGRYLYITATCDCGTTREVEQSALRRGISKSCGCLSKELAGDRARTHGNSKTLLYAVWNAMRQRCENANDAGYANYGGRGIEVCEAWKVFEVFRADMGDRPFAGAMLERKDNDGPYCKDNCTWVSRKEQNNHKRNNVKFLLNGQEVTLAEAAGLTGVNGSSLRTRVYKYGMSLQEAVDTPMMRPEESGKLAGNPVFREVNKRQDGFKPYLVDSEAEAGMKEKFGV